MNVKKSNLYNFVIKTIAGEEIDNFNLGVSSKNILKKIKYFLDLSIDNDFKNRLLKEYEINIRMARRMILEEQTKKKKEELKNNVQVDLNE